MKRRNFLTSLGVLSAAVVVAPYLKSDDEEYVTITPVESSFPEGKMITAWTERTVTRVPVSSIQGDVITVGANGCRVGDIVYLSVPKTPSGGFMAYVSTKDELTIKVIKI
jgi:hypothetical protein